MKSILILLSCITGLALVSCVPGKKLNLDAAPKVVPGFLQARSFQSDSLTLPYRWISPLDTRKLPRSMRKFTPEADGKYPLVIFLHGSGERGDDNRVQLRNGAAAFWQPDFYKRHPHFFLAPQCPKEVRWSKRDFEKDQLIFEEPTAPMETLMALIEKTVRENPAIDPNRVYVTGLSMGGMGTFDLIARRPEWFAAAIPVCGGADPGIAPDIRHIAIWVFHGSADDVVNVKYSRRIVMALRQAGALVGYSEYPGWNHNSWTDTYADPKVLEWLFRQKKKETGSGGK